MFRLADTDRVGALCSPVAFSAHERGQVNPFTRYDAFLAQACQRSLAC